MRPTRDGHGPGPLRAGHGDADELQADPRTGGDVLGTGEQYVGQCSPDVTAAEQSDAHGRGLMGVRGCAGLVDGHLQTVQGAGTVTCVSSPPDQGVVAPLPAVGAGPSVRRRVS